MRYNILMETEHFKTKLIEERGHLIAELKTLGVTNPQTNSDWIPTTDEPSTAESDPNDLGDRSEEWQERRGTLDVLETRLNNVVRALKKIELGTYGMCEISGEVIEEDRLTANPAARTCKSHINDEAKLVD